MNNSFYSAEELQRIGFKSIGNNVQLSRNANIYGAERIVIGNNVRIDDFCILSGDITLRDYIHISAYSALFAGNGGIEIESFSGISSRCAVYAVSDDYSGNAMTNPMIPDQLRNVVEKKVVIKKHALIGTGSTILPGVTIGEGVSVGSMSLVNNSLDKWGIYAGIPCRRIKDRNRRILELEKQLLLLDINDC